MAKISNNTNIFFASRKSAGLTREQASNCMGCMSVDRLEKIENERISAHPDDVLLMAKHYKDPALRRQYCSTLCPLGTGFLRPIQAKSLSQITLEMLASLNALEVQKNRLIEITVDGQITEDEYKDFNKIREQLEQISASVDSLKLWIEKMEME